MTKQKKKKLRKNLILLIGESKGEVEIAAVCSAGSELPLLRFVVVF